MEFEWDAKSFVVVYTMRGSAIRIISARQARDDDAEAMRNWEQGSRGAAHGRLGRCTMKEPG